MVPFHGNLSLDNHIRDEISGPENLAKKRKWREPQNERAYAKVEGKKSILDIELHLETPLPLDWQRCLDIQSGKIHFYNTKTKKRTSRDPRDNDVEEEKEEEMSLDLKLNLTCESMEKNMNERQSRSHNLNMSLFGSRENINHNDYKEDHEIKRRQEQEEMVAAVCMRCHLLVMLCKTSPECPNCKFMHSPEQTPSTPTPTPASLFKRRCSLSW